MFAKNTKQKQSVCFHVDYRNQRIFIAEIWEFGQFKVKQGLETVIKNSCWLIRSSIKSTSGPVDQWLASAVFAINLSAEPTRQDDVGDVLAKVAAAADAIVVILILVLDEYGLV